MKGYMIGIDQSTQGTKALLFDEHAILIKRVDIPHKQIISKEGYVSHDPLEIYNNTLNAVRRLLDHFPDALTLIRGVGISNQRETTVAWNRESGLPLCDAVVWQCSRAAEICDSLKEDERTYILKKTGMPLSPYFPAAKMSWIMKNYSEARELASRDLLCFGTIDTWLLFCLTKGKEYKTDYSNASRTQLLNLEKLEWDDGVMRSFGISDKMLPKLCDSNAHYGSTDFDGILPNQIPIHAMMGDSHGALYGQGCHEKGMVKATYGTGSSLMMNTGSELIGSKHGIVSSVAWSIDGKVNYVLEGNLNYTGSVITWLKDDMKLIESAKETENLAFAANIEDTTYLVPAFTGLGAPYWKSNAKALLYGMSRTTGRAEIVKASLDCIAYQITDILKAMEQDSKIKIQKLCVDGGPTRNKYLMKFQSNIADLVVRVPDAEELSGIGAAYMAGITLGIFSEETAFSNIKYEEYTPCMEEAKRQDLYQNWLKVVSMITSL